MPGKPILLLLPLAVLCGLSACDRPSRDATPASTATRAPAAASAAPASGATVALSGAIADLPASTTPDAVASPASGS